MEGTEGRGEAWSHPGVPPAVEGRVQSARWTGVQVGPGSLMQEISKLDESCLLPALLRPIVPQQPHSHCLPALCLQEPKGLSLFTRHSHWGAPKDAGSPP